MYVAITFKKVYVSQVWLNCPTCEWYTIIINVQWPMSQVHTCDRRGVTGGTFSVICGLNLPTCEWYRRCLLKKFPCEQLLCTWAKIHWMVNDKLNVYETFCSNGNKDRFHLKQGGQREVIGAQCSSHTSNVSIISTNWGHSGFPYIPLK